MLLLVYMSTNVQACLYADVSQCSYLSGMGHETVLEYLLIKPYIYRFVNYAERNGWTAAHLSALRNRAGCLAILIDYGADIHMARDKVCTQKVHVC